MAANIACHACNERSPTVHCSKCRRRFCGDGCFAKTSCGRGCCARRRQAVAVCACNHAGGCPRDAPCGRVYTAEPLLWPEDRELCELVGARVDRSDARVVFVGGDIDAGAGAFEVRVARHDEHGAPCAAIHALHGHDAAVMRIGEECTSETNATLTARSESLLTLKTKLAEIRPQGGFSVTGSVSMRWIVANEPQGRRTQCDQPRRVPFSLTQTGAAAPNASVLTSRKLDVTVYCGEGSKTTSGRALRTSDDIIRAIAGCAGYAIGTPPALAEVLATARAPDGHSLAVDIQASLSSEDHQYDFDARLQVQLAPTQRKEMIACVMATRGSGARAATGKTSNALRLPAALAGSGPTTGAAFVVGLWMSDSGLALSRLHFFTGEFGAPSLRQRVQARAPLSLRRK